MALVQSDNLGKFYRYANGRMSGRKSIPPVKDAAGNLITDKISQANIFNRYLPLCLHVMMATSHSLLVVLTLLMVVVMWIFLQ